ncbi:sodium-coupled neutral amino acid transporter 9 isoform X3 [Dermochelys coriacea]|uniref:sodium-coupled neutral amino acid transporter 9 isoform X3 n=1 Tax=Dermochelys coriacea TaxID=27794 RepID=UPI001CA8FF77|nr:sodium-coupled neutral amino acid transporter 9 isoform X3 [Dermochelys coriacea]
MSPIGSSPAPQQPSRPSCLWRRSTGFRRPAGREGAAAEARSRLLKVQLCAGPGAAGHGEVSQPWIWGSRRWGQNNLQDLEEMHSSNMEEDTKPLLIPVGGDEKDYGIMNIQFDPADLKCKRPFHVEPSNIVSVNDDTQRVTDEASAMNKRIHYYSKLTSPSDRALIAPDHVLPAPEEMYVYSPLGTAFKIDGCTDGYGKNSSIVTIFMIWNTMMGTSILSMPWGIKQAGFTTGICLILLMGSLTLYCCYRVVKSRTMIPLIDTSNWEFPDVCKYYFGSFGQWSSLLFSMVSLVGAMVIYWVLMSNFLFNTGKFIYNYVHDINVTDLVPGTNGSNRVICPGTANKDQPGNKSGMFASVNNTSFELFEEWWSKSRTVPFYLIVVVLPLLNLKSPSFFAKFNILEFRIQFPQLTGVLTLAFFIHNCVITLLKNNKNQENNVRDLSIAYFLVGLTYLYVGLLIFAAFPSPPLSKECIEQNFLDNFPSNDIMSFVARLFLLFQMITVYPLLGYLARVQLLGHVFGNVYPSIFHVLVLNIAIVGLGVTMAMFYPNIGGIIRYSGATCGLAFVFVYPSLIYMISLHQSGQLTWSTLIIHIFILILGLANLIAQFLL